MVDPKWTELSFSVVGGRCGLTLARQARRVNRLHRAKTLAAAH